MTKFIALVKVRGAPGNLPIRIDAGEHRDAAAALAAVAEKCEAWFNKVKAEMVIVCPERDERRFIDLFREPVRPN